MVNGLKVWPAISVLLFTVVPVDQRLLVGGLVNVGWGVFLSLVAAAPVTRKTTRRRWARLDGDTIEPEMVVHQPSK